MSSTSSDDVTSEEEEEKEENEEGEEDGEKEDEPQVEEEEEEEELDEPRAWWVLQRVWILMGFPKPVKVPLLHWPQGASEDDHLAPLME